MKYFAVIDTNVIVSALLSESSYPRLILTKVFSNQIVPLVNEQILFEYQDVLNRAKFNFNKEHLMLFFNKLYQVAIDLDKNVTLEQFTDYDDRVFYQILLNARNITDSYLITGNIKHFPGDPFVVTPKQMIEMIDG